MHHALRVQHAGSWPKGDKQPNLTKVAKTLVTRGRRERQASLFVGPARWWCDPHQKVPQDYQWFLLHEQAVFWHV